MKPIGARRPYKTAWLIDPPPPAGALAYEGAADVLRAVARWPSNGLTSLESAVSMTLNSTAIAGRLDGLAREGLIDRPRAATITPAGLRALEALDAPTRRTEAFDPPGACMVCRGSVGRRVEILGREIACPICNGGSWLAALPEPPPAQAESSKPRSEAHALVGDDFSRQLREAATNAEEQPLRVRLQTLADTVLEARGDKAILKHGAVDIVMTRDQANALWADLGYVISVLDEAIGVLDAGEIELSEAQKRDLLRLFEAGAVEESRAVITFDHPAVRDIVPGVIAALAEKDLARAGVKRRDGRGLTHYWLTEAGTRVAQRLAATARGDV